MSNRFLGGSNQFLELNLESVLRNLKLENKTVQFIASNLSQHDYPNLYQDLLHLFLLNPELRTNIQGTELRKCLFECWLQLFKDKEICAENERKLQTSLQRLMDFYMHPQLQPGKKISSQRSGG